MDVQVLDFQQPFAGGRRIYSAGSSGWLQHCAHGRGFRFKVCAGYGLPATLSSTKVKKNREAKGVRGEGTKSMSDDAFSPLASRFLNSFASFASFAVQL